MIHACIDVKVVELALVSRKIAAYQAKAEPEKACRWAAMSAHLNTGDCECRDRPVWRFRARSMLSPLQSGYLHRVVEQVRMRHGPDGVRKIWGKGYRAMQAETQSAVIR